MIVKRTKASRRREAAIKSGDINRILLTFSKATATQLYYNGTNAENANKLSDAELMKLKGIKEHGVYMIRRAARTAVQGDKSTDVFRSY